MPQSLFLGNNRYMTAERSWADNGKEPEWAMVGGQKVKLSDGARSRREIFQNGTEFFYKDGKPVTQVEDVDYLPEPFKTMAIEFVTKRSAKVKPAVQVFETPAEAKQAAAVAPVKRGRGRPSKTKQPVQEQPVLAIMDEASYLAAGGVIVN